MTDLRTRIARALLKAPLTDEFGLADAVIAELGLSQECSWHVPVSKWAPHNPKHVRYVTDWKQDDK